MAKKIAQGRQRRSERQVEALERQIPFSQRFITHLGQKLLAMAKEKGDTADRIRDNIQREIDREQKLLKDYKARLAALPATY